jgi:hypothetical protein
LILVCFVACAVLCFLHFDLDPSGMHHRQQIMVTSAVVILTFVLRCVFVCLNTYSLYYAVSEQQSESSSCVDPCSSCHSTPFIINRFLFFCPELRAVIIFLSSPFTLLVACWGMTSQGKCKRSIAHFKSQSSVHIPHEAPLISRLLQLIGQL